MTAHHLNMDISKGTLTARKGWRTFKAMIKELDRLNKHYKKNKISGDFTIRFPIKGQLTETKPKKKL